MRYTVNRMAGKRPKLRPGDLVTEAYKLPYGGYSFRCPGCSRWHRSAAASCLKVLPCRPDMFAVLLDMGPAQNIGVSEHVREFQQ